MASARSKPVVSRDPEIVMSRILDAAQAEFMAAGYEGSSTNRICEAFGGSKATVFRYFPSKEKMLEAVTRRIASRWSESVTRDKLPELRPEEWLQRYAAQILSWILSEEPIFLGRLGVAEGHKFPELSLVFEELAGQPLRAILAKRLAQWTKARLLLSPEPERDARYFLDLLVGGPVSRALYRAPDMTDKEMKRHIKRGTELFLHGCRLR